MKKRSTAIVLAAGMGSRMQSKIAKQYMLLCGKPVLYYSLAAFEQSEVDDIILVVGKEEIEYCKREIVERYEITKVRAIVTGGSERYLSVINGLDCVVGADYVMVHDGARPFVTPGMIAELLNALKEKEALVVGVPSKDTVKLVDANGMVTETPDRKTVYNIQTPQAFSYSLLRSAYDKLLEEKAVMVTDDAMVVEQMLGAKVTVVMGSYQNIKITTPEDMIVAEAFLNRGEQ
ncbi:MAG: 2-C-methyl-D-erythritol 4-phosphate cytidylyltransferase [Lachnospiraceae bacterium]|nr:2-C-methyl-D-erythritol 4-phosphate cytidylyltransferase [Lachnospiraceae bacterium]